MEPARRRTGSVDRLLSALLPLPDTNQVTLRVGTNADTRSRSVDGQSSGRGGRRRGVQALVVRDRRND
ncbi:hypothetical protein WBP07_20480 (plasmid) [Novosphingobium sp. BL-8A]|uniref:hypothetical protein n=1 Tax=Novosphingobium sp. BL-8A TaxID=3127639 RepID=UPI003756E7E0